MVFEVVPAFVPEADETRRRVIQRHSLRDAAENWVQLGVTRRQNYNHRVGIDFGVFQTQNPSSEPCVNRPQGSFFDAQLMFELKTSIKHRKEIVAWQSAATILHETAERAHKRLAGALLRPSDGPRLPHPVEEDVAGRDPSGPIVATQDFSLL